MTAVALAGCSWIDPLQVVCATTSDCVDGYVCSSAIPTDLGTCVERAGGGGDDDDDVLPETGPVSGLDLVGLSVNQGVEIRLLDGTDWIDNRNSDVVAGRPGLLRVYVEPQDVWEPRSVRAVLDFDDGRSFTVDEAVSNDPSEDTRIGSTINFDLAGEEFVQDVGFSVRLLEVEYDTDEDGSPLPYEGTREATRWPRDAGEFADLGAGRSGVLDLRLVPVRYNADGSGRVPDTSDAAVEIIRAQMMKMYPTQEVRVTLESPMDWGNTVSPNGAGWSELLQQIFYLRQQRSMPGSSYTYGLFAPAVDRWAFCGGGCVAGLSIAVLSANDSDSRVSIGLGYGDVSTAETMAHEVGHAHGRSHGPCSDFGNINNVDPNFPYQNARLGVVGYDILDGDVKEPNNYADLMAYCDPIWVSDYTWNGFMDRIRAVGPQEQFVGDPQVQEVLTVLVGPEGLSNPLRSRSPARFARGEHPVTARGVDGDTISVDGARFLPFDHVDGGLLVFPAPPDGAKSVEVEGFGTLSL